MMSVNYPKFLWEQLKDGRISFVTRENLRNSETKQVVMCNKSFQNLIKTLIEFNRAFEKSLKFIRWSSGNLQEN